MTTSVVIARLFTEGQTDEMEEAKTKAEAYAAKLKAASDAAA